MRKMFWTERVGEGAGADIVHIFFGKEYNENIKEKLNGGLHWNSADNRINWSRIICMTNVLYK